MVVRRVFGVAICAAKHRVVTGIRMTVAADAVGVAVIGGKPCVIESSPGPIDQRRKMARQARSREIRGNMIWIRRGVVFGRVARVAIRGCAGEFVAYVAHNALRRGVFAHQRKARGRVIERGSGPVGRAVAQGAILGEARRCVRRIIRSLILR